MADLQIIAKVQTADPAKVAEVEANCAKYNPKARTIKCNSKIAVDKPELIKAKRAIVIEDGPTLTHGGMTYGAGWFAAKTAGVAEIVDCKPYAVGTIKATYVKYPNSGLWDRSVEVSGGRRLVAPPAVTPPSSSRSPTSPGRKSCGPPRTVTRSSWRKTWILRSRCTRSLPVAGGRRCRARTRDPKRPGILRLAAVASSVPALQPSPRGCLVCLKTAVNFLRP